MLRLNPAPALENDVVGLPTPTPPAPEALRLPADRAPLGPRNLEDSPLPERVKFAPPPAAVLPLPPPRIPAFEAANRSVGVIGFLLNGGDRERADVELGVGVRAGVGGAPLTKAETGAGTAAAELALALVSSVVVVV